MGVIYYANPNPIFQPSMRLVTAITRDVPAAVTTSFAHDYITGTIVRMYVPQGFGMTQINTLTGSIEVTGSDTFNVNIDTREFDPFIYNTPLSPRLTQIPLVIAIGEVNSTLQAAVRNTLP